MNARIRLLITSALVLVVAAAPARAQQASVITGQVTTKNDGVPLPGAMVSIPSLNVTAATDEEGRYTLNVPASAVRGQLREIQTTFAGLTPSSSEIRLTPGGITHDVAMTLSFAASITVGSRAPGAEAEKAEPMHVPTPKDINTQ